MSLAFRLKYGRFKKGFQKIASGGVEGVAPPPPPAKTFRKSCETPVGPGAVCGHAHHEHRGSGEFACKVKGCPCRIFTYWEET